ncbi:MAG: repeat protein, partial [Labilithrix sp.]|nr:repeat protein [Labilithrix sp.]
RKNKYLLVESRSVTGILLGTTKTFDAHGRTIRELRVGSPGSQGGDSARWLYDANGWLLESLTGPSSVVDRIERDTAGHVTRTYDFEVNFSATGRERRWTYRPDGLPLTMVEHGVTRTYTYAELPGSLDETGWTDTLGRSMTYTRDAYGNVTSTSDGTATTYAAYDARNRVTETRDALNNTTTYGYTHAGCGCSQADLVTSIHTPDLPAGVEWTMAYDGDDRLASVTDPHEFTESYAYETTGELKKVTDKLARDTTWSHDQLGRVLAMVDTLGRRHAHAYSVPASGAWTGPTLMAGSGDATAAATSLTGTLRDGDYQIGHNAYQPAGASPAISLYRDATFQLGYAHVFDTGNRRTGRRDRVGLGFATTTGSATGTYSLEDTVYENATARPLAHLLGTNDGSGRLDRNFEFDVMTTNGFWGGGEPEVLEFFTRDAGGRPTLLRRRFIVTGFSGGDVSSTYAYWPDGRIKQIVNPDGTHDFTYDARGLMLTQVVSGEGTYTYGYDVMGRPSSLAYPDGHTRTQVYDDLGRITSRCYEYSGQTTRCYTAQYDAVGNPVQMVDPDGTDTFEYDALDRLKKVTRVASGVTTVEDYEYNSLGALKVNAGVALAHQRPRLDGNGNADAAVPATAGGQPVTLDPVGRVTSLRGTSFTWSGQGFLRQAQDPIPAAAELYGIDSNLRRTSKTQGGAAEVYVFEGLDRVATLGPTGAVKEGYLFDGIDHPLRINVAATSTTAYYEIDLAGNVRALRASGGASLGGYRYSAFGQTLDDTSSITQPLRWKARWYSPVAGGTYDVRARQWSPEFGVFLSVDEFGFHDVKSTLWGWAEQSPPKNNDPSGHDVRHSCPPGVGPLECSMQCHALGATCQATAPHPHGPHGPGGLVGCKGGWPTNTCSYRYDNGDVCTFFRPGGFALCDKGGGKKNSCGEE